MWKWIYDKSYEANYYDLDIRYEVRISWAIQALIYFMGYSMTVKSCIKVTVINNEIWINIILIEPNYSLSHTSSLWSDAYFDVWVDKVISSWDYSLSLSIYQQGDPIKNIKIPQDSEMTCWVSGYFYTQWSLNRPLRFYSCSFWKWVCAMLQSSWSGKVIVPQCKVGH